MASKTLIRPDDIVTLTTEKQISSISTIERALGILEGITVGMDAKLADTIFTAIEMLENAVKEITDGK